MNVKGLFKCFENTSSILQWQIPKCNFLIVERQYVVAIYIAVFLKSHEVLDSLNAKIIEKLMLKFKVFILLKVFPV